MAKIAGPKRHGTYIILGEQMEWAKELVVLEIERAGGLEIAAKGEEGRRLDNKLLWGADLAILLVVLRGRDARSPPRPATMVAVVVVGVHVRGMMLGAVARKHGCDEQRGEIGAGAERWLCVLLARREAEDGHPKQRRGGRLIGCSGKRRQHGSEVGGKVGWKRKRITSEEDIGRGRSQCTERAFGLEKLKGGGRGRGQERPVARCAFVDGRQAAAIGQEVRWQAQRPTSQPRASRAWRAAPRPQTALSAACLEHVRGRLRDAGLGPALHQQRTVPATTCPPRTTAAAALCCAASWMRPRVRMWA